LGVPVAEAQRITWQDGENDAHSVQADAQGRRAHVLERAGDGARWWLDGSELHPHPADGPSSLLPWEAKMQAEQALLGLRCPDSGALVLAGCSSIAGGATYMSDLLADERQAVIETMGSGIIAGSPVGRGSLGLGDQLAEVDSAPTPGGVVGSPSPRGTTIVYGEDGTDVAVLPPFEATDDISRRQLKHLERANQHHGREVVGGVVAREKSPRQSLRADMWPVREQPSLVQRVAAAAPAEVQQQLRERAERAEGFMDSVRALAETEDVDPELVAALKREAAGDAIAAAEAGVEVLRELQHAKMIAQATIDALQADIDAARLRRTGVEAAIERIKEHVLRPAARAAGAGKTRRLNLATATVYGVWRNPPAVAIEDDFDPRLLPEDLQRIKVEADKDAIKEALVGGAEVPGCSLVHTDRVEVR
jgi:hypothetical protein